MNRKLANQEKRGGFTLVEMLVVVMIIGILAGLITAAALRARNRAKVAVIAVEIKQLEIALNNYKTQFGEYPPDFFDIGTDEGKAIVLRHISRAFPRFVLNGTTITDKWNNLQSEIKTTTNNAVDINNIILKPSTALRFWLGGMPDSNNRPIGFSKDPAHPFDNTTQSRIGPFFDFDPSPGRLPSQPVGELGRYYPPGVPPGAGQPYVYFRAETGQSHPYEYYVITSSNNIKRYLVDSTNNIYVKPYWDDRTKCWVNDTSFQLLCCGLDGKFGRENIYPSGQNIPTIFPTGVAADVTDNVKGVNDFPGNFDHIDDQTNFTSGTIGDDLP